VRILVTGGAGFVGGNLAIALAHRQADWEVTAFDNLKRRGSELNLSRLREAGIPFLHGDVRVASDLLDVGPFQAIVECSAEPSALAGLDGGGDYVVHTNLLGAHHCLELARRDGAYLVFLSTSRVYPVAALNDVEYTESETRFELQPAQELPGVSEAGISEAFPLDGARTLYGTSKLAAELLIAEYAESFGVRAVVNRFGVIAGPWQMGKVDQGFVVLWAARHLFGGELHYAGFGGLGLQVRDVLHVDDLCELVLMQIHDLSVCDGQVFNVGGGLERSVSLLELTGMCRNRSGRQLEIPGNPETNPADVPYYVTDNSQITAASGWVPRLSTDKLLDDLRHGATLQPRAPRQIGS